MGCRPAMTTDVNGSGKVCTPVEMRKVRERCDSYKEKGVE